MKEVERRYRRILGVLKTARKREAPETWREAYGEIYSLADLCSERFREALRAGETREAIAFLECAVKLIRLAFDAKREFEFDEARSRLRELEEKGLEGEDASP